MKSTATQLVPHRSPLLLSLAILAIGPACADVDLQLATHKARVQGMYCPSTASVLGVPLRIMMIIDTSASMTLNDPNGGRLAAAEALINNFSPEADVEFAVVTFDDFGLAATIDASGQGVFTRDPAVLGTGLSGLTRQDGFTNYLSALNEGTNIIQGDIIRTAEEIAIAEAAGEDADAMRPYYFVIFLSDGIPRLRGGVVQDAEQILFGVRRLIDVPEPALGATLHTAFLGADGVGDPAQVLQAETLLGQMAEEGRGNFFSFADGDEIDFKIFDFQILRLHDAQRFFAYNPYAALHERGIVADSDADGLADVQEDELGSDSTLKDTDNDGLGDGYEFIAGTKLLFAEPYCQDRFNEDKDGDGLTDCEENFRSYNPEFFDTDLDLFPDYLELLSGTNPANPDIHADLDFDGRSSERELLERTNPKSPEGEDYRESVAYEIHHERREFRSPEGALQEVCYDFSVDNVSIVSTRETLERPAGYNEIVFEFIESPEDASDKEFVLRRFVLPVEFPRKRKAYKKLKFDLGRVDFEEIARQHVGLLE